MTVLGGELVGLYLTLKERLELKIERDGMFRYNNESAGAGVGYHNNYSRYFIELQLAYDENYSGHISSHRQSVPNNLNTCFYIRF